MTNLNDLAKELTLKEGKIESLSIAQIKEVIKLVAIECFMDSEVVAMLVKLGKKHVK